MKTQTQKQTVYKVVRKTETGYKSYFQIGSDYCHYTNAWILSYAIGKTTYPIPGTHIYTFSGLEYAKKFITLYGRFSPEVVVGEATVAKKPRGIYLSEVRNVWKFWTKKLAPTNETPKGTVEVTSFTPQYVVAGMD